MRGARGDAHANEWPGAMMPALPAEASRPTPSFSSSTVTSWPALARKYAVVTPTTPPPSTNVFMLGLLGGRLPFEQVAGPDWVVRIEPELARAGEIGRARDFREDRRATLELGEFRDAANEAEPE